MPISDDKTRILITIPKELKSELEKLAKKDTRPLSNLIVKILTDYVKNNPLT